MAKKSAFKAHQSSLKAGDKAPEIKGNDQDGKTISLKDYKGKKVVLYFYPKDSTPGCTAESCNLRDNYKMLMKQGYEVIGVSPDSVKSHKKFAEKYKLPFPLIADEKQEVIKAYDVWGKKMLFGVKYVGLVRTTFIIHEKGIIEEVINEVDTKNHTQQIIKN